MTDKFIYLFPIGMIVFLGVIAFITDNMYIFYVIISAIIISAIILLIQIKSPITEETKSEGK